MARDPQIKAIMRGLRKLGERVVTKVTLDVTANLVESTPVDTGWARANWVPSIGAPSGGGPTVASPGSGDVAGAQSMQQAALVGVAATYRLPMGRVFVSNNVPYIVQLNDGSSRKEPAGFVQRAIRKAVTQDITGLGT